MRTIETLTPSLRAVKTVKGESLSVSEAIWGCVSVYQVRSHTRVLSPLAQCQGRQEAEPLTVLIARLLSLSPVTGIVTMTGQQRTDDDHWDAGTTAQSSARRSDVSRSTGRAEGLRVGGGRRAARPWPSVHEPDCSHLGEGPRRLAPSQRTAHTPRPQGRARPRPDGQPRGPDRDGAAACPPGHWSGQRLVPLRGQTRVLTWIAHFC